MSCGKKGFRISAPGFDQKLKSLCGSTFGLEDFVFSRLLESHKEVSQRYFLNYPQNLSKVYVNGTLYGIFMSVPTLDD